MNNKKMDFDILENADINTIEKIGADNMNIDKNARDRMLKNAMSKYQKEKQLLGTAPVITREINGEADSVSGVENYSRKKITHIVSAVLSTAAALVIVGGSIFMLNRHKPSGPETPDPVVEASTSVSGTTMVSSSNATTTVSAQNTSSNTTSSAASTANAKIVTVISSATESVTNITTAEKNDTASNETDQTNITPPQSDLTPCSNPHTDRTDITNEEIEDARIRALNRLMNEGIKFTYDNEDNLSLNPLWDIESAVFDVNGDNIPELFVRVRTLSSNCTYMLIYDGSEYVQAKMNLHTWSGTPTNAYVFTGSISVCPEKKCLHLYAKEGHEYLQIIELSTDNTLTTLAEYNYSGYYKNGAQIIKQDSNNFSSNEAMDTFRNDGSNNYSWRSLTYTPYAEKNAEAEKFESLN